MLYFKNPELAKLHHVTLRTVLNWIEAAKRGKLDLTLHAENGKSYVANTARNVATIKQLVEDRKKYRNTRAVKVVSPRPEFYKLYSESQIHDIINSLQIHHEIPRQYNYFDGGASNWDKYAQRLADEDVANILNSTQKLLAENQGYIDALLSGYTRVNIVDIGVGNVLPVKALIQKFLDREVLGRYIALDVSEEMLKIAESNIKKWFKGQVQFEGYELDMAYERFSDMVAEEYLTGDPDQTLNIVLLLGGTLSNLRYPDGALRMVHDSMGLKDILLHTDKLDTQTSRTYFDFSLEPGKAILAPNHRFIFDLLNIDESFYEVEMGFDSIKRHRYVRVRLKAAVTVKFEFAMGSRVVELQKGESILLWRAWASSALDIIHQLDRNDLYMLHASQTEDQEYILTISRVKCE